jgi:hypothetical protein
MLGLRRLTDVWRHMQGSTPTFSPLPTLPKIPALAPPREILFETTPDVDGSIRKARANVWVWVWVWVWVVR